MAKDMVTAAWDYSRLGLGAVSGGVNGATFGGGTLAGTVGWTSGVYMHSNVSGTCDGLTISPWRDAIIAMVTGGTLIMAWSATTGLYTLSHASNFTVTWYGALGTQIRDALGFTANLSGTNSYTSTVRPDYLIITRIAGQSAVHETYESGGRIEYAEADDGTSYSTRPSTIATYREWTQPFETNVGPTNAEFAGSASVGGAPVRRSDATTTAVSWSWEDFYKQVRAELPFSLLDRSVTTKGEGALYKMRGEAAHWDPTRVAQDFDGHWSMPIKAVVKTSTAAV
jgi:hypothetical protein